MPKICNFETCRKQASYGEFYGKPLRCKEHKEEYRLISKLCKNGDCKIRASFNFEGLSPIFCCEHKLNKMIDTKHKKCIYDGCKMRPNYNIKGEFNALYCVTHKTHEMVNINSNTCKYKECNLQPSYNFIGQKTALYCFTHKQDNMINIKSKKCIFTGCNIQPNYNYKDELIPLYCIKHKEDNMIDIHHNKCIYEGCIIRPNYNFKGENNALYCVSHKLDEMIDINHDICIYEGCNTRPTYNLPGEQKALYCVSHKLYGMIDIKHKKCKANYCLGNLANPKYKGHCSYCYQQLFPNDPLTLQSRSKTKEIAIRDFININFEGFQHDKPLWTGNCDCTHRRRIDHRKLIGNTLLCIGTDENQHKGYDKADEAIRYDDLYMLHGGKFIFIHFNPDKFKNKEGKNINPMLYTRLPVLKEEIEQQIKRIENEENTELLEIVKLYYDE